VALHENVQRHCPKLWREQTWLLHHDNTLSHTSVLTQQFLEKNEMAFTPHPPYSPDLATCDFFLFPKLKFKQKGRRFDTTEEIQAESHRVLDTDTKGLNKILSKNGDGWTGVYMRERTTSRVNGGRLALW
jgi:hypothetical protein